MFQSPSRSTPATRLPREAAGLPFQSGGPSSLSSPRGKPADPTTLAMKCAPLVGFATPSLSSVAKATKASCILPESSWRSRRRLTPALHIRLLEVACGPPLAYIRPICAFHAQTSMRTSGLSLQPGALPGKGSAATLEATDGLSTGRSTRLGTVDSGAFALGAILSRMPYFFRL